MGVPEYSPHPSISAVGVEASARQLLIVSANGRTGQWLCRELQRAAYRPTLVPDSRRALRAAVRLRPALVVIDEALRDMGGDALLCALRRLPRLGQLPAISIGRPDGNSNGHGLFVRTLEKPVDAHELVETVAHLLDVAEPQDELQQLTRENAMLKERLADRSVELAFLAGLGIGISSGAGADHLMDEVLKRCAEVTGFQCGAAYLAASHRPPVLQGHVGFRNGDELRDFFGDPRLLAEAIAIAGDGIARMPSAHLDGDRSHYVLTRAGLGMLLVAPVLEAGELLGVLVLGSTRTRVSASQEILISAIAAQMRQWLSRVRNSFAVSRSQRRTLERLARAAEFRDEETANHTQRVSRYSELLAGLSGVDRDRSELIAAASVMHDIGKLGIPDSILRKPGKLNAQERRHMQRHADYGHKILAGEPDPLLDLAAVIAWTHHERWDGEGYPRRLRGEEIPLEGRIVAIGDVFDALTSDRVYRPAMSVGHAVELMRDGSATQFDPELLDLFIGQMPRVLEIRRRHPDDAADTASPLLARR